MYEIIYVDDSLPDRRLAAMAHRDSGVKAPLRCFASGTTFLAYIDSVAAEDRTTRVVLMDLQMPGEDGLAILNKLALRPLGARTLVWMFSNSRWQNNNQEPLRQAGAVRFLSKPADYELNIELFRELGKLLEPRAAQREPTPGMLGRLLLVEDSQADAILLGESLKVIAPDLDLVHAPSLLMAHEMLNQSAFDGLILDLHLPDAQETSGIVSLISAWPHIPIVAVSGRYDQQLGRAVIRSGAQDFVNKAKLEVRSLLLLIEFAMERQQILNKLRLELSHTRNVAMTDALTGLPNRRALLDAYWRLPVNVDPYTESSSALVVIDIDRLKSVNDMHGHKVGDELIQLIAATLKDKLRAGDLLARVGGDEFVVLLHDLPPGDWGELLVDRMREAVENIPPLAGGLVHASASFGHAKVPRGGSPFDTVFAVADARMYDDKASRRQPDP